MSPHDAFNDRSRRRARCGFRTAATRLTLAWLAIAAISWLPSAAGKPAQTSSDLDDALQAIRTGRAVEAAARLESLLEADPTSATLHHYLGLAYESQGRHEAAVRSLERALTLEPTRVAALAPLAWSQFYLGRSNEARANFNRYLRFAPGDAGARLGLGLVEFEDGRSDRARLQFLKAIQLARAGDDARDEAHARSALADVELRDGNLATAVRLLEAAIRLRPADGKLRLKLAHALDLSGDAEGAAAARDAHARLTAEESAPH